MPTMVLRTLHFLTFIFCVLPLSINAQDRYIYSQSEAEKILFEFDEAIEKFHPYAYRNNNQKLLDSVFNEVRAKISLRKGEDSIHVADLIAYISSYNDLIGDGHLQLTRKRDKRYAKKNSIYNYEFYTRFIDDGRVILSDTLVLLDSTTIYPGAEVFSIEGHRAPEFLMHLSAFIGLNDHNLASAKTYFPALDPGSFYQRLYGWKDSLKVELIVDGEKNTYILIPSAKMAYINSNANQLASQKNRKEVVKKNKKQVRLEKMKQLLRLDTTAHPDIYILGIRTFSSGAFNKVNEYAYTRKLIKRLDSLQAKGLIIDLRNNTGGSLNFVNHIFSMIAKENFVSGDAGIGYNERARGKNFFSKFGSTVFGGVRKKDDVFIKKSMVERTEPIKRDYRFNGEVVVLVNETTFSGGTCLANYVKTYNRGKLVGQISGGSAERMYAGSLFKEPIGPEGSLVINMPLWYMDMPGDNIGNLTPDILVPRTLDAIVEQRDDTLLRALECFSFVKD